MTARALLRRLDELGVELSVRSGRVQARAPEGVLTSDLRDEIASRKDELLEILSRDNELVSPIPRTESDARAKLSPGQERIWRLARRDPQAMTYHLSEAFRVVGPLDTSALDAALLELARRHENLRTEVVDDAVTTLRALPAECAQWDRLDVSEAEAPLDAATASVRELSRTPFDLTDGPLARFHLVRLSDTDHVISITMHHMISDGWSFEVVYDELAALYAAARTGLPSSLPPVPIRWVDVAMWLSEWTDGPAAEVAREYWREVLAPPLEALALPRSASRGRGYEGEQTRVRLSLETRDAVDRLSAVANASPFMVWLAAYAWLLRERTGQDDILICVPAACRERHELQGVVGYLNNVVVLRVATGSAPTFVELVHAVREASLGAFRHQDLPFQEVAEFPHLARVPLTRAMFAYQGEPARTLELDGLETTRLPVENGTANFDIALYVGRSTEGLDASLSFKSDALSGDAAERFLDRLSLLVIEAAQDPTRRTTELADKGDAPVAIPASTSGHMTPTFDSLEVRLTLIWERVLGTWPIHLDDDFFALGGHSLLAVRLLDEIERELGRELPLATFFEVTTVRSLARALQDDGWVPPTGPLVEMQASGSGRPMFVVHSFEGHTFFYNELAQSMGPEHPVYGLQAPGLDGSARPMQRVDRIAQAHLREIRRVQPEGPYTIAAMCFGVAVALDLAVRLHEIGEKTHIVFLDSVFDGRQALVSLQHVDLAEHRLSQLLRRGKRVLREQWEQARDLLNSDRDHRMRSALARAWHRYDPRPFDGTITLIRSEDKADNRDKDWQPESLRILTGATVDTHLVSGDHLALLREPNVQSVSGVVKSLMG